MADQMDGSVGTVGREIAQHMPSYNVLEGQWGVKGDGKNDDGPALLAMLAAVGVNARIVLPKGTYLSSVPVKFYDGQQLEAEGFGGQQFAGQTLLKYIGAGGQGFALGPARGTGADTVNVGILGLSIDSGVGDGAIDFTRCSYGEITRVHTTGSAAGAIGLKIDAQTSGQAYFNVITLYKGEYPNGIDMACYNGANDNIIIGGWLGSAQTGLDFSNLSSGNVLFGTDFEGNSVQHVNIPSGCTRNNFYGAHMENAPIGFKNRAAYFYHAGTSFASSVTTPVDDTTNLTIDHYTDPSDTAYLNTGYLRIKMTANSGGSTLSIDPTTVVGTANALINWLRNVTTSGTRQFNIYAGDGTANVTFQVVPTTGATRIGLNGTSITQVSVYTPSLTPTQVAASSSSVQTYTVTGLATTDKVVVNAPLMPAGMVLANVRVSAANTLELTWVNVTAAPVTPPAGTYSVIAFRS